ncbi:hypothetical protein T11_11326 [Trichinella zimbabwensis]|uniref:Uncharacterized protein n=1 Tax=Trichinella zimbabwensis TaxID=268475 RepID=A0A0V1GFV3_9BILA|nr:hypothetical protein T11_11326 [Trichinella zimbabwensis]
MFFNLLAEVGVKAHVNVGKLKNLASIKENVHQEKDDYQQRLNCQ